MNYKTELRRLRLRHARDFIIRVTTGALVDIGLAYFLVLWGLERIAIESGLEFYPDQTFANACYLCAILWGIKAIK